VQSYKIFFCKKREREFPLPTHRKLGHCENEKNREIFASNQSNKAREREREKSLFFNTIRLLFFSAFQPWESKDI
jgi:hypothetical protein